MEAKREVELMILAKDFKETYYNNQNDCPITRACRRAGVDARHTGGNYVVGRGIVYQLPNGVVELVKSIFTGLGRMCSPLGLSFNPMLYGRPMFFVDPIDIRCTAIRSEVWESLLCVNAMGDEYVNLLHRRMEADNQPDLRQIPRGITVLEDGSRGWLNRTFPIQAMSASIRREAMAMEMATALREINLSTPLEYASAE